MSEKLFAEKELREMEKRTVDRLIESIESGDKEGAKKNAQRMYKEFESMHDLYRDWAASTLSAVGRNHGDEALEKVLYEGVKAWWGPNVKKIGGSDSSTLAKRIKMFVGGLHGHLQPLNIVEDEEKVVIQMKPCGSGGRLVLEGKYEGPDALLQIEGPQTLTYGRDSLPVYCTHEPPMEQIDMDINGNPFVVIEPAAELGKQHCSFIIYKNPEDIPERYYERVGRKKPTALENKN